MKNCLEKLRRERQIQREDLAAAMGVSRQTIISLEKGCYNPSIIPAFKLASYFEWQVEDIFFYEEESA